METFSCWLVYFCFAVCLFSAIASQVWAQLMAKELAAMEASSSGAEHGSPLRSDTQLRLAKAVVRHCQAAAAAAAAVSLRATLQDKSPRARLRPTELLLPHAPKQRQVRQEHV